MINAAGGAVKLLQAQVRLQKVRVVQWYPVWNSGSGYALGMAGRKQNLP